MTEKDKRVFLKISHRYVSLKISMYMKFYLYITIDTIPNTKIKLNWVEKNFKLSCCALFENFEKYFMPSVLTR